jgi:hypothetical protein
MFDSQSMIVPKYLAEFSFTDAPNGGTHIRVSKPGSSSPFFTATLTPARYIPSLPLFKSLPLPGLIHPPIPGSTDPSSMHVGSSGWIKVAPATGGWLRLVWTKVPSDGESAADSDAFTTTKPASWGFELPSFVGDFPVDVVLTEDKKTR